MRYPAACAKDCAAKAPAPAAAKATPPPPPDTVPKSRKARSATSEAPGKRKETKAPRRKKAPSDLTPRWGDPSRFFQAATRQSVRAISGRKEATARQTKPRPQEASAATSGADSRKNPPARPKDRCWWGCQSSVPCSRCSRPQILRKGRERGRFRRDGRSSR